MVVTSQATAAAGCLLAAAAVLFLITRQRTKYASLPPSPPSHILHGTPLPATYPWRYFYTLSLKYGPLITIWNGRTPAVVCNDMKSADFFLEKNARDTADRPRSIVGDEIFSHGKRMLLVGHNERWRRLRKAIHHALQPQSARELRPVQLRSAHEVVRDILASPDQFQEHIQTYAATLVVHMAYGRTDKARYGDADIQKVIVGAQRLGTLLRPGAFKIEAFPLLRYWPGYLKQVNEWADEELALFRNAYFDVKRRVESNEPQEPCFATFLLKNQKMLELNDDEISYLLGSVFGAGSDTSSSAITICVMAAACYPEVQARVQAELDNVCGDAPPTFDDLDSLPVLRAFVAESYRWRPVSSGGFQHATAKDIIYENYVIPAGTPISGNHWAIHRDVDYFGPDVESFKLDRWLDDKGAFKDKMKHVQFGFGRRVCPGQHVANNSVLINAAVLLWSFDIAKKRVGQEQVEIDTLAFTNTANSHPLPFQVAFTARHEGLEGLMADD